MTKSQKILASVVCSILLAGCAMTKRGTSRGEPGSAVDTGKGTQITPEQPVQVDPQFDDKTTQVSDITEVSEKQVNLTLDTSKTPLGPGQGTMTFTINRKEAKSSDGCASKLETTADTENAKLVSLDLSSEATTDANPADDELQRPSFDLHETFKFDCQVGSVEIVLTDLSAGHDVSFALSIYTPNGNASATSPLFKALNKSDGTKTLTLDVLRSD